jgi:hypothetical protein
MFGSGVKPPQTKAVTVTALQNKNSNQILSGCDGSSFSSRCWRRWSTDKHLIVSVSLVNGLRYWRYENLEPATEARHNRGHFARRLDHFSLDEIGGGNNLIVRSVDCLAD